MIISYEILKIEKRVRKNEKFWSDDAKSAGNAGKNAEYAGANGRFRN